jgi:hypothetical protein
VLAIQDLECTDIAGLRTPDAIQRGSFVFSIR